MILRIVTALSVALLAHAGAYAIISVGSPKKADIQMLGGSISISLLPTDELDSEDSETDGGEQPMEQPAEEPFEMEAETPSAVAPELQPVQPAPEQFPEPEPEPIPEPDVEPNDPVQEPATLPEAEPDIPEESAPVEAPTSDAPSEASSEEVPNAASSDAQTETTLAENATPHPGAAAGATSDAQTNKAVTSPTVSAELGNAAKDNYNGALMRHMRKARKFDTNARRSSKISITIDARGDVLEVRVLRASGDKTWDRRVVKELKRIAPYPAPPSGGTHSWSFDAVPK